MAIGVGGGLIRPMQDRWERMLTAAERETVSRAGAYQQARADPMRRSAQAPARHESPAVAQQATPEDGASRGGDADHGPEEWREPVNARF